MLQFFTSHMGRRGFLCVNKTKRLPSPSTSSRHFASSTAGVTAKNTATNTANRFVDLRSDTVTSPSRAMLETALVARTGDDVFGEDVTVLELEAYVADLFGKERGLFVPTGTMSNLVAIMAHCSNSSSSSSGSGSGSEIIVGAHSHISLWEGGGAASLGGVHTRQLQEDAISGQLDLQQIRDAFRNDSDDHCAQTKVLCLENTHNMMGGVALPVAYMNACGALTRELGISLHVDGARIFNAATALNCSVKELCAAADSVSVCLSKGLGAPLGSVLVGKSQEMIRLAKRARKRCGGGMRQAGVVAAMGLYALQHNVERLAQDHDRAKRLANMLQEHGFRLAREYGPRDTNIFYFRLPEASLVGKDDFLKQLALNHGVKVSGGYSRGGEFFRVVTHLDLTDEDIGYAADAMIQVCCCSRRGR